MKKTILEKNEKKNMWGKLKLNSQPAHYEKNKIDKDNSRKKIIKKKPCGEIL